MKFIFLSFRRNILPAIFVITAIALVVFSKSNLLATRNGLELWANNVVPSLFPFFVITELLSNTNIVYYIGKIFDKIMRPIFNVPGEAAFAFIMGFVSGYPTGGKIVADLRRQGLCTRDEGNRMLAFTNNSGPLFIISCVGISLFGDTKTGFLLLITHILAGITVGMIFGFISSHNFKFIRLFFPSSRRKREYESFPKAEPVTFRNLGSLLAKSINDAISTTLLIGGFIVIFSVVISMLAIFGFNFNFAEPIMTGLIELTNGVNMVSGIHIKNISQNVILCAFLLGFGGISVLFQVFSMISKTDLSINKYIIGKILQGTIAATYTFIALQVIPILQLDL